MTVTDEDTVRLLRAAVRAAGADPGGSALPDRLLAGVRRRRRARRAAQAAGTAVLVGGAAGLVLLALPGGTADGEPTDGLVAAPFSPGSDTSGPEAVEGPPSRAGAVTRDQAARPGLDGSPQCEARAFQARGPAPLGQPVPPPPRLVAAYLTDTAGFEQWTTEYSGGRSVYRDGSPFGDGLVALCWFDGDIPPDLSVPTGPDDPRHRLLAVQLDGPGTGVRLDTISEQAIPVLAPPPPAVVPAGMDGQGQVVHPQPEGVAVVEQMRTPAPPPLDCLEREIGWTGC